jgi:hypothetical protein
MGAQGMPAGMDPAEYMDRARKARTWGHYAWFLRKAAQAVMVHVAEKEKGFAESGHTDARLQYDFHGLCWVANMLHGLAVEVALKGRILATAPEKVTFELKVDGAGEFVSAQLRQVGVRISESHDLTALAKAALDSGVSLPLLSTPEIQKVLQFLGACVRWAGRYPVPLGSTEVCADGRIVVGSEGIPRKDVEALLDALIGDKFDGHTFPDKWP